MPTVVSLNILLMKQTANAQQNVLTAMKTTQLTRSNVRPGILKKEIQKVKYTRNISFPEARKIVESYTAAPGKSYASITKTAGVTVSCVDAATQTDPVLITAAPQSSSYNAASTEASASTQKDIWLVGCFGLNGPLRQYFSPYRAASQREGERKEK